MKIHRTSQGQPKPNLEVEPSELLEEIAEWRQLPVELLAGYGVHVDDHPTHPIVIPYPNLTNVWYERRRAWIDDPRPNKYLSPKGSSPHLYNPLHLGPNASQVWLCEGEFDTLTLIHYGLPAVGVAGTNAFNRKWVHLFSTASVIIAYDGDTAGMEAGAKLADAFRERRTRTFRVPFPEGSDANELHIKGSLLGTIEAFADDEGIILEGAEVEDTDS